MSIGGSSRAASPRVNNRPRGWRAILYALALGILIVLLGTQPHGQAPSRTGPRLSVTVADAATSTHRAADVGRDTIARGAVSPALPAAVLPDPIFAAASGDVPADLLFDPSSLIATTPKPRIDMSNLVLRSETILPSDAISGEPAPSDSATTTAALPEPIRPRSAAEDPAPDRTAALRLSGTWAADRAACGRRNSSYLPMVIDEKGARAGASSCRFDRTRQAGNRWAIAATCRSGQETWSANVKLVLDGTRLTWSSERGTERYQRCR